MKDRNVAMMIGNVNSIIVQAPELEGDLNWDLVTLPHFAGQPVVLPSASGFFAITSKSEHKDLTMQVLSILLEENSDRVVYENPAAMKRNMGAIKNQKVSLDVPSRYEALFDSILVKKIQEMVSKDKDVNTTLRELQEELQKSLDQQKGK
jgi:hypothetical protein